MKIELPPIPEAERTALVEALLAIIDAQQQRIQELDETVGKLRDEMAVLKGEKPRPKIAPSRLESPPVKTPPAPGNKRPGSAKRSKTASFITPIEVKIPFPDPPPGSTSKGYEEYFVQELVLTSKVTRYLRERILTPDGKTLLAPLPDDVLPAGHFGPTLIAHILHQYHHCNVTQPLLLGSTNGPFTSSTKVPPLQRHPTSASGASPRTGHRHLCWSAPQHPDREQGRLSPGKGRGASDRLTDGVACRRR
jgi:hypothetical protein